MEPIQWLKTNKLLPYRMSGDELEIGCPFEDCPNSGEKQFYINRHTGSYYCHRCEKKGVNLKQLEYSLGFVRLQDPVKSTHVYIPERELHTMRQQLLQNEQAMSYLTGERGLASGTINQFKLAYKIQEGSPAIFIPTFDKTGTCVGGEYDFFTRPAGLPKYKTMKNSKQQLYNLNGVDLSMPLYITEGRYDTMALWQYGWENVGSMPSGASNVNGWVEEILDGEKYILATDNDTAGEEAAQRLSERLGASKCFRVYPRLKDFNEAAQRGLKKQELSKWLGEEVPLFNAPVADITSYLDKAEKYIDNPSLNRGLGTGWSSVDFFLGGIRMKEVTVVSGATGNGKTTFGMALVGNLINLHNMRSLVVSPEMREEKLLIELANHYHRKQVNKAELKQYVENHKGMVRLANVYGTWTEDKEKNLMRFLFDMIEYSVRHFGVKFVFIDHLRLFTSTVQEKERAEIDEFMKKCVRAAMINNAHIMVVVQPRKLPPGQRKVASGDLKGSANIEQDSHNLLLIHREENSDIVEFSVEKNRELGTVGEFKLKFDNESKANYNEITKD